MLMRDFCVCSSATMISPQLRTHDQPKILLVTLLTEQSNASYDFYLADSCAHRNWSEHAGSFPSVNPLTLKSEIYIYFFRKLDH